MSQDGIASTTHLIYLLNSAPTATTIPPSSVVNMPTTSHHVSATLHSTAHMPSIIPTTLFPDQDGLFVVISALKPSKSVTTRGSSVSISSSTSSSGMLQYSYSSTTGLLPGSRCSLSTICLGESPTWSVTSHPEAAAGRALRSFMLHYRK